MVSQVVGDDVVVVREKGPEGIVEVDGEAVAVAHDEPGPEGLPWRRRVMVVSSSTQTSWVGSGAGTFHWRWGVVECGQS